MTLGPKLFEGLLYLLYAEECGRLLPLLLTQSVDEGKGNPYLLRLLPTYSVKSMNRDVLASQNQFPPLLMQTTKPTDTAW
jgi:hypothetical protein